MTAVYVEEADQPNFMMRWLTPALTIMRTHRRAYLWLNDLYYGQSIKRTFQLYGLVVLVLAVAAVYEVLEAAFLVAQLGR